MHAMILTELRKILATAPFDLEHTKLASVGALPEPVVFPEASVFLIDAEGTPTGPLEVVRQVLAQHPRAHLAVLGENFDETNSFPLLNVGVKGLVTYEQMSELLVRALQAVSVGGYWVPRVLLALFVDSIITKSREMETALINGKDPSRREREIIDGLLMNLSNKEIATKLNISERTVKFHVSNLLMKFNVQRRADLILLCYQHLHASAERPTIPPPQIGWRVN
jgi:DNA-binding NarL/FixJ family response regulator